jgi:hypothetical protein
MTNAHNETGKMAICCQNLMLGVLSSHSVLSVLVGALFRKFSRFEHALYVLKSDGCMLCSLNCFYRPADRFVTAGSCYCGRCCK